MPGRIAPQGNESESIRLQLTVLRCQAGDEQAFAELMASFEPRTLRYLRGMLGDDGDDVQQEVWLSVYRNLQRLADPRAFKTWLFRTTRHKAIDFLRARRRERAIVTEFDARTETVAAGDPAPDDTLPFDEADLQRALGTLGPEHREVVLLRFKNDLSYGEIATLLGCSVGTVRSRLHYAKERMHDFLTRGTP